jgi:hypothetical protein
MRTVQMNWIPIKYLFVSHPLLVLASPAANCLHAGTAQRRLHERGGSAMPFVTCQGTE